MFPEQLKKILNLIKKTGDRVVIFDAANLSNGVYFYKIQAGNFTGTKKLILMK